MPYCLSHCDTRRLGLFKDPMREIVLTASERNAEQDLLAVKLDSRHATKEQVGGWLCDCDFYFLALRA